MGTEVEIDDDIAAALTKEASQLRIPVNALCNVRLRAALADLESQRSTNNASDGKVQVVYSAIELRSDWHIYKVMDGVDPTRPGIYEWVIEGRGSYIGKYKHLSRPRKEYETNLRNLLAGKKYRLNKPDKFRRIHHELKDAYLNGRSITLVILENVNEDVIAARERELIDGRGR